MRIKLAHTILYLVALLATPVLAQDRDGRYVVFFRDKLDNDNPYSIDNPSAFLSQKSMARRTRQGIAVTEEDLPVNPHYITTLQALQATVYYTLRWVNGALIEATSNQLDTIKKLPSVDRIEYVAPPSLPQEPEPSIAIQPPPTDTLDFLLNKTQLSMLGLDDMHTDGIQGEGITVAVIDAGFRSVNKLPAFADIFKEKRLTDRYDFLGHTSDVFRYHDHGTNVLSVMAASIPDVYQGGTPKANYQLYITDDYATEYRVEEYNWMAAAERADSAGVDIITASLGYYSVFDDKSMNYTTSQLNGKTAVVSRAASKVLSKGILVVIGAGNSGRERDPWHLVLMPADVAGAVAVGSVTKNYVRSVFSSVGPTADGRIKPDVTALGEKVLLFDQRGDLILESGTSFSAPQVASLAVGLLQLYPDATPDMLYDRIVNSGTRSTSPDNMVGYGTPSYNRVIMSVDPFAKNNSPQPPALRTNPVSGSYMEIQLNDFAETAASSDITLSVYTLLGQQVMEKNQIIQKSSPIVQYDISDLLPGMYLARLRHPQKTPTAFLFIRQ